MAGHMANLRCMERSRTYSYFCSMFFALFAELVSELTDRNLAMYFLSIDISLNMTTKVNLLVFSQHHVVYIWYL